MARMKLGGIKVFEKRAFLCSSCGEGEDALGSICSTLAGDRVNLGLLAHIADVRSRESVTAACAKSIEGFAGYIRSNAARSECRVGKVLSDICRISIFPHDQMPAVTGTLIGILARLGIRSHGFASSPSGMTVLVASSDFKGTMEGIFDSFTFPAYGSFRDWKIAYPGQEEQLDEVRCRYHEQIIHIYDFAHRAGLDYWKISLPSDHLSKFGEFLFELDAVEIKMPFFLLSSTPEEGSSHLAFCTATIRRDKVKQTILKRLPDREADCHGPVTVLFLHGPHFGDRYGIADAFLTSLRNAGIRPLALSCALSSISAVFEGSDPNPAIEALQPNFQMPDR